MLLNFHFLFFFPQKLEYTGEPTVNDVDVSLPSFKLIRILKSMSSTKAELNKVNKMKYVIYFQLKENKNTCIQTDFLSKEYNMFPENAFFVCSMVQILFGLAQIESICR